MLDFKSKKIILAFYFCALLALLFPAITHAGLGDSGGPAARDAAEQKAAKERKLERKRKAAEAKKAAEAQQSQPAVAEQPAGAQQPAEGKPEMPAAQ
jgi:hypothetical protein